jgi:hypothetical protein
MLSERSQTLLYAQISSVLQVPDQVLLLPSSLIWLPPPMPTKGWNDLTCLKIPSILPVSFFHWLPCFDDCMCKHHISATNCKHQIWFTFMFLYGIWTTPYTGKCSEIFCLMEQWKIKWPGWSVADKVGTWLALRMIYSPGGPTLWSISDISGEETSPKGSVPEKNPLKSYGAWEQANAWGDVASEEDSDDGPTSFVQVLISSTSQYNFILTYIKR